MSEEILNKGLGRKVAPDIRDAEFPLKALLPKKASKRTQRYWNTSGYWGDQGETSQCVAYAWTHWLEDGPVTQPGKSPIINPAVLYKECQRIDEWPGENYDGTSVRAGAKALVTRGFITEYRWAYDVNTLAQAILEVGPVVVGTNWYSGMFYPDFKGVIKPTGYIAGGHAYKIDGVNMITKMFRIKNSWGRSWGENGFAYISFDDMAKLIREQGEVCLAVEKKSESTTVSTTLSAVRKIVEEVKHKLSAEARRVIAEADRIREKLMKK